MEIDAIDETTETSVSDEIQPLATGTKYTEKCSSEILIGVSNDSIVPTCCEVNGKFDTNISMNFLLIFF